MTVIYVGGSSPYATIQAGIQAAELAGANMVVVNPGDYTENDILGAADSGLTIMAASSGVVLTGSFSVTDASAITISGLGFQGTGADTAIQALDSSQLTITANQFSGYGEDVLLDGSTGATVSNNVMTDTAGSAIEADDGADGGLITNNVIDGAHAAETRGAIWLHGSSNSTISHNQISNTDGSAISLTDFDPPGTTATQNNNDIISYNALNSVDTKGQDSGVIYILGRSQNPSSGDLVTMNAIGVAGSAGAHAVGIYLDDNASGVTVTRNIVQATPTLSDPWEVHGGSNNTISGNIFDLGTGRTDFGLFQADEADQQPQGSFTQLENDQVEGNIFVTESSAPHDPGFADLSGGLGDPSITGNDFWAFSGAPLNVAGAGATGDASATYDPPAAAPAQSLADYSTWSGAGIGFAAIDTSQIGAATVACYCRGTLILTECGEVAVEDLKVGDCLITVDGKARAIQWIGRRSYGERFLMTNPALTPILIQAAALGSGLPRRDLRVSPKHAMFLDGLLIPAAELVNGTTIDRDWGCQGVDYFHVELDSHDVIWAEGAASETYLEDGDRAMFQNAPERCADHQPRHAMQFYGPRVDSGFQLERVRSSIGRL